MRAVSVLNLLADHPEKAFTLTDIIRSLKLSRATCHSLLAALVEAGYLYRASDKTYILGPALARIGAAAQQNLSPLQVAAPEMRALADEFDVICSVVFREKDDAVVRERAVSATHLGWALSPGTRMPLRPPLGSVFMAWSSEAEINEWLKKASDPSIRADTKTMQDSLTFARAHGFVFGVRKVQIRDLRQAQSLQYDTRQTDYLVGALSPDEQYELAYVTAPVFDRYGRVAFLLAVTGFTGPVRGAEVEHIGIRVRESCDRISGAIGGRKPDV